MIYDAWLARHRGPRAGAADHAALELIAHHASRDHAGRARELTYAYIGRVIGRTTRQVQTIVHRLAAGGWLKLDFRRGFANVYRVLFDHIVRQVEGEAREQPAPSEFAALGTEPAPARDILWHPNLDHHPQL